MILQALEATYAALLALYRRESETPSLIMFLVTFPVFLALFYLALGSIEFWNVPLPTSTHSTAPLFAFAAAAASGLFVAAVLYRRRDELAKRYAFLPSLRPTKRRIVGLLAIYLMAMTQALIAARYPFTSLGIFVLAYGVLGFWIRRFHLPRPAE
jgi:hypothetical protein